jgi:transcriptional regulator with XRE-family HTH domain
MPHGRAALAAYISQKMKECSLSTREVARRSGIFQVSNATVWNAQRGRTKEITEHTLRGLAQAFEVPEAEVLAIYRGSTDERDFDELRLVEYFKGLPHDRREDVLLYLEHLYKKHGSTERLSP